MSAEAFEMLDDLFEFADLIPEDRRQDYLEAVGMLHNAVAGACAVFGGGDPEDGWNRIAALGDFVRDVPEEYEMEAERSLPKRRRTPLNNAVVMERWAHDAHAAALRRGGDSGWRDMHAERLLMAAVLLHFRTLRHREEWEDNDGTEDGHGLEAAS